MPKPEERNPLQIIKFHSDRITGYLNEHCKTWDEKFAFSQALNQHNPYITPREQIGKTKKYENIATKFISDLRKDGVVFYRASPPENPTDHTWLSLEYYLPKHSFTLDYEGDERKLIMDIDTPRDGAKAKLFIKDLEQITKAPVKIINEDVDYDNETRALLDEVLDVLNSRGTLHVKPLDKLIISIHGKHAGDDRIWEAFQRHFG